MNKNSYPNNNSFLPIAPTRDTSKWVATVRNIYNMQRKNNITRVDAIKQATQGWNVVEIFDFLNWLKFYESGAHVKYKAAQLWYENGTPGYFLHIKEDQNQQNDEVYDKKTIIEKQRAKIVSRLDSIEKLLRTTDGRDFAGDELEHLIEALYSLKKKIQLMNKKSISTIVYDDMIIREGNVLNKNGFRKAAELMYSLAQIPPPAAPNPPTQLQGSPGGLSSMGPGAPQIPPNEYPNDNSVLFEELQVEEETDDDILEVYDNSEIEIVAQELPEMSEKTVPSPPTAETAPTSRPTIRKFIPNSDEEEISRIEQIDSDMDAALSGVTIADVVAKLESLSKIFKTREISRQLGIVDMMLDTLGLASYFPSLSEAMHKNLENTNYISTRIDDILDKLRGSMHTVEINLEGDFEPHPEIQKLKNKLDEEKREKAKEKEIKTKSKAVPNLNLQEELNPETATNLPPSTTPPTNPTI